MKTKRFQLEDIERLQAKGIRAKEVAPVKIPETAEKYSTLNAKNIPEPHGQPKTYLIGIDPDVEKCGFAIKDKATNTIIEVKVLHFFDVINRINALKQEGQVIAYIDAGWLISKSNWHEAQGKRGEKIAKNVGACHQVGKLLCEYFTRKGIKHFAIKPTTSKVEAPQFKKMGIWEGRINQDQRDACLLLIGR